MKRWLMWGCGLLIAVGIGVVALGAAPLALLPAAGCALMMGGWLG